MEHGKTHFSQGGEDIVLENIFQQRLGYQRPGYFVDVGAFHPYEFSNTYLLYQHGWRGMNIEPRPGSKELFDRERPRDLNLELAISDQRETQVYYMLEESPSANSLSPDFLQTTGDFGKISDHLEMETVLLVNVLDQYLPPGQKIDLLNVDVEGLDYQVLCSNDWEKYRPRVVVVELNAWSMEDLSHLSVPGYLRELGYELVAKTYLINEVSSAIWVDKTVP
jgi:FkbM family methyltransferase